MQFVIITGISGSGKSLALRIFEDMGFYCVDNMPPALIPRLAELCEGSGAQASGCSGVQEDGATAPEQRNSGTPEHSAAPEARVAFRLPWLAVRDDPSTASCQWVVK